MEDFSELDYKQKRKLVERLIPFESLVDVGYGNCFCLFHENKHTKAAKFFHDDDGVTRLQCWGICGRQFTAFDYITMIMKQDPLKLINKEYTKKELNDILKVLKESGDAYFQTEDFSNEVYNKWIDSDEDLSVFLDDLYTGFNLKEV